MSWFKIDDGFHCHPKVFAAGTAAIGLYVRCGSWAAQQTSDGIVPKAVARMYGNSRMIRALVDADLWHAKGHMCDACPEVDSNAFAIHNYLDFNPSRETVESERTAKSERQRRWRENRKANGQFSGSEHDPATHGDDDSVDASTDTSHDGSRDASGDATPTRPDPTPTTTSSFEEAKREEPTRIDVEQACNLLADLIEKNGSRRPAVTKAWRTSARLMIDRDRIALADILGAIRWSQNDPFWCSVILSMPKLRKQYEQLRLKANAHHTQRGPQATNSTQAYADRGVF